MRIRNQKSEIRNVKGFTLVEMLIVTAIALILLSIGGRTYYHEKDIFTYNNALEKTLDIIKTARNYAINITPITIGGVDKIPVNGYGVYINLQPGANGHHLTLFASQGTDKNKFTEESDYIIETYQLPKQITLQYLTFDGIEQWNGQATPPSPTSTEAVIFFRPPLADIYLGKNDINSVTSLNNLGIRFINNAAPSGSKKKCQHINIDKVKGFPEITYSDCST